MANSSEVNADLPVLVSDYNNLRRDILNITSGHNHSGSVDAGKQLSGSIALASYSTHQGQMWYGALFLIKRQGGSSTDWKIAGISNYDISSEISMQTGIIDMTILAGNRTVVGTINYGTAFTTAPLLFANIDTTSIASGTAALPWAVVNTESSTYALVFASRHDIVGNEAVKVAWFAIGETT